MSRNTWVVGDVFGYLTECQRTFSLVLADPMYGDHEQIRRTLCETQRLRGALVMFMYPEDLCSLGSEPDQVVHWVKPISTKNTCKRYSRFVEAIAVWHGPFFNKDLHWSARSGVFTDALIGQSEHPFKKPDSLIEKLVRLHCPPGGSVLDLFAGSGTTRDVCVRLGLDSVSVERGAQWAR